MDDEDIKDATREIFRNERKEPVGCAGCLIAIIILGLLYSVAIGASVQLFYWIRGH